MALRLLIVALANCAVTCSGAIGDRHIDLVGNFDSLKDMTERSDASS